MAIRIPGLGELCGLQGLIPCAASADGHFRAGRNGVEGIYSTGDRKVELIAFERHSLALVKSALGYTAYYPVLPVEDGAHVKAVLMDLDGTTVKSEEFWIGIIQMTARSLLGNPRFSLEQADLPFVSGHSVSEHLEYCIAKYCPGKEMAQARELYFAHTRREMHVIVHEGKTGAFAPNAGVKEFLLELKSRGMKIALVTSGLYEKAYPEILSAFRVMGLGDPARFYDSVITAGTALGQGAAGTLGELEAKPHPWLYAESAVVGLGIPFDRRGSVIGIEDSGAGVCSVRLAGFYTVGIAGGNILQSGTRALCGSFCSTFEEILRMIDER